MILKVLVWYFVKVVENETSTNSCQSGSSVPNCRFSIICGQGPQLISNSRITPRITISLCLIIIVWNYRVRHDCSVGRPNCLYRDVNWFTICAQNTPN